MTRLTERKTKLIIETSAEVREHGKYRSVVIEAHPYHATVRLKGMRTSFEVSYEAIYSLAVKQLVAKERAEKKARRR